MLCVKDKYRSVNELNYDKLTKEKILDLLKEERFKSDVTESVVDDAPPKFDPFKWVQLGLG